MLPKTSLCTALTMTAALVAACLPDFGPRTPIAAGSVVDVRPLSVERGSTIIEDFDAAGDTFISAGAFWSFADRGVQQNANWFAESGGMSRRSGTGWTNSPVFRMWTRRTDLAFASVQMDIRFNGWSGGREGWHGVNLWLNRALRTPSDGSRVDDGPRQEGYTVDFLNRDGAVVIQKKVGDRYHLLHRQTWRPTPGAWYRWAGRVVDNQNGTHTIQVLINDQVVQEVTDNGSVGGPPLRGGRVGLRGDHADISVENLSVTPR